MTDSLSARAFEYVTREYQQGNLNPESVSTVLKSIEDALAAIDTYVDRPADEKDVLKAAHALILSPVMVRDDTLPPALETYGDAVKMIVEDYFANRNAEAPYMATRDLMQIGLASAISSKDILAEMVSSVERGVRVMSTINDPAIRSSKLFDMIKKIEGIVATDAIGDYCTGEQPRLEQAAHAAYDESKELLRAVLVTAQTSYNAAQEKLPEAQRAQKPHTPKG